jgi:N-methylhydantoinase B/oxoprolinase/acetone carboxylase alpha subunit
VLAEPGTVVNVNFPGPSVGGNTETHCRIANVVMGALAPGLKQRSAATDGASHSNFLFGGTDNKTGEFFCCYDLTPVGWGGRSFADGNDAVGGINGNCPHIPVEVFEYRFPWHVEEFKLVDGSGGPGIHRGGLSLSKTVRCTDTEMTFSYMSDRQKVSPWGIHGGHEGGRAELFIKRAGREEWLTITQAFNKVSPSKFANVPIQPGDRIKITSPAGGGWGPPENRDKALVKEDLLDGFITPEQARTVYAVK